jgi:hypothetical protein
MAFWRLDTAAILTGVFGTLLAREFRLGSIGGGRVIFGG